ncbi:MAG: hypothetical protein RL438_1245, partial [Actinomycetota bacterium]
RLQIQGHDVQVSVTQTAPHDFVLRMGEVQHSITAVRVTRHEARFVLDRVMQGVSFEREGHHLWLLHQGQPYEVLDRTRMASARQGETGGDGKVRATMNGRVVAIAVAVASAIGEILFPIAQALVGLGGWVQWRVIGVALVVALFNLLLAPLLIPVVRWTLKETLVG